MMSKRGKKNKYRKRTSSNEGTTRHIDIGVAGVPGMQQHLLQHHRFKDPSDPRNVGGPGGLPGPYKVVFTLSRPGFSLLPDNTFSSEVHLKGDSHLAITKPAYTDPANPDTADIVIYANTPYGELKFIGYPNKEGFLGKIELPSIQANNYSDAAQKAYHSLTPALSIYSTYLDVPLHIYQTDITELRTNSLRMSMLSPFLHTPFYGLPNGQLSDDFLKYASIYREALTSNSPNYQFLCYYKIIEGIKKRQDRLFLDAKSKGEPLPTRTRTILPKTREEQIEWLSSLFYAATNWDDLALALTFPEESLGRKVNDVVQNELSDIRVGIAHAVLDSDEPPISIDKGIDIDRVNKWLPLTKFIARLSIKLAFPEALLTG